MVLDFQNELFKYIESRMSGSNGLDECCYSKPSRRFLVGSLAPKQLRRSNEAGDSPTELADADRASIKARQLRVSILTRPKDIDGKEVSITVNGSVYYKVFGVGQEADERDEGEGQEQNMWKREGFSIPIVSRIEASLGQCHHTIPLDFKALRDAVNKDPSIVTSIPDSVWQARLSIESSRYAGGMCLLHFYLTNMDAEVEGKGKGTFERALFNVSMEVTLDGVRALEFCDEYQYSGFPQRYYYSFRTINCQAEWVDGTRCRFRTKNYAIFQQPNIVPKSNLPGVDLSFRALSSDGGLAELDKILVAMESARAQYESIVTSQEDVFDSRTGDRQYSFAEKRASAEHFHQVEKLFERGLGILKTNKMAMSSFIRMNQAFDEYYENRLGSQSITPSNKPSWRLFQIVFILSGLRSIVNDEDLDCVDVLHVATGGGKSEAYFGLTIFSMFLERMRGKKNGVTAIVKFPLRMLSVQQLERLSSIIIYAEKVRREHADEFEGDEFSLGYYVGNSDDDFPDFYYKQKKKLYTDYQCTVLKDPAPISKIISKCPLCQGEQRGNVRLVDDNNGKRILHVCDRDRTHVFYIYLSDREIFRYRPTVIVSTVDKWAGLSQQRRVRALLGSKGSICPHGHGFIPCGDKCEESHDEKNANYHCEEVGKPQISSWGPILSIQDELHLLREGFGTISSHFEGLIEQIVASNPGGKKLKHIAMSATLNGVEEQIRELYNKEAIVIPGSTPDEYSGGTGFFFEKLPNEKRTIYGLKPNLRDSHYASLRTILHYAEFIQIQQKEYIDSQPQYLHKFGYASPQEAIQDFKKHITPLTYHLKKQDAEDMYRLSDTVINDSLTPRYGAKISGRVLTGERGLDELKETIDEVREKVVRYEIGEQAQERIYSPIFATSVVSHGVDLEELNFMVFQGIPHSTSEYIQALSRVGRKYRGMVIVWFYPNRVRDDSFYRNFQRYHESLDHEVRPVPINRRSRLGMLQTINSLFCASIIQHISEQAERPLIHKEDVKKLTVAQTQELVRFIKLVYGVPPLIDVESEVEIRLNQIKLSSIKDNEFFPNVLTLSGNYYFRNQSGMRGIQQQLALELSPWDEDIAKSLREG